MQIDFCVHLVRRTSVVSQGTAGTADLAFDMAVAVFGWNIFAVEVFLPGTGPSHCVIADAFNGKFPAFGTDGSSCDRRWFCKGFMFGFFAKLFHNGAPDFLCIRAGGLGRTVIIAAPDTTGKIWCITHKPKVFVMSGSAALPSLRQRNFF